MADPTMHEVLAELATLRAKVEAQERRRRRPVPARLLPLALVALLVALTPVSLLAANFTDLNAGSPHNGNINAIADAGITKGCNPPDNDQYCPNDLVTREQMASFLARTAGLGGNPPVANALTAQTATNATHATSADTATSATNAANATQLNGQPASFYQPAGQPIANATNAVTADNANTVGGYAPGGLVRAAFVDKTSGFPALTYTATSVATLTIQIPAAGFVLVTSTVAFYDSNAGCPVYYILRDEAGHGPSYGSGHLTGADFYGGSSQNYVFPATPGTKTISVRANLDPLHSGCTVTLSEALIGAIFVPFGYNGGTTLGP